MTTTYYAHTSGTGTRIREDHNTAAKIITKIPNANTPIVSTEKFVATETLSNANGVYQQAGDVWLKVDMLGAAGWVAVTHLGVSYVVIEKEVTEGQPDTYPTPPQTPQYQDMAINVNIYNNEVTVLVNGEEFVKRG